MADRTRRPGPAAPPPPADAGPAARRDTSDPPYEADPAATTPPAGTGDAGRTRAAAGARTGAAGTGPARATGRAGAKAGTRAAGANADGTANGAEPGTGAAETTAAGTTTNAETGDATADRAAAGVYRVRAGAGRGGDPATIREVATLAGVSTMTVSRVLRGSPSVTPANRERVEAAVKALAYRPNVVARSLRQGRRTGTVGLVVTNLANPFYARLALGIEAELSTGDRRVMITNTGGDVDRERAAVRDLTDRRVDGLVLVPAGHSQAYLGDELPPSVPVVTVGRPPTGIDADCVLVDDVGGAHAATRALLAAGHRRIGFLGNPPSVYTGSERYRGFCAALDEVGVTPDEAYVRRAQQDLASAERAAGELLSLPVPPTAILCTNNRNTIGAYRALRRRGVSVTIAGFDDFELADVLSVPVTIVAYDADELGRRAARLLVERIDGAVDAGTPPRRIVVPTTIVEHLPPAAPDSPQ
ncbi:hypothetical protein Aru02nite_17480 [Actinocatenispora rupis]|uniref:HTH lacI-type domain-containing protein n=1 Tax=Actinocatenispora rupis TaxID=519421 RepID=A0A8J3NCV6_9ACTN|nr:hypothetical protein Aru02nite_17480 [Actinocatenispora rupis]